MANGYSSESSLRELSYAYQHDRVWMVFKHLCVLWTKVPSAIVGRKHTPWWSRKKLRKCHKNTRTNILGEGGGSLDIGWMNVNKYGVVVLKPLGSLSRTVFTVQGTCCHALLKTYPETNLLITDFCCVISYSRILSLSTLLRPI